MLQLAESTQSTPAPVVASAPPDGPRTRSLPYNPGFDGIRGLAMLQVFTMHYFPFDPSVPLLYWINRLLFHTRGVDLFFVLSGCLITGILLNTRQSPHYFKNFYMRRLLRILPLYYAVLILCHMNPPFIYPHGNPIFLKSEFWYWAYMMNNHLALNLTTVTNDPITFHFWSLSVEEQFYLAWPLVVFFCSRRALIPICAVLAAGSLVLRCLMLGHGSELMTVYIFFPTHLDGLALGSLVAVLASFPSGLCLIRRLARPILYLGLAAVTLLICFGYRDPARDLFAARYGIFIFSLFSMGCVAVAAASPQGGFIPRVFSFKPLMILGKYSYGFYIYHCLIKYWVDGLAGRIVKLPIFAWLDHLGGWTASDLTLRFLLAFAIVFLVAFLSWHLFEKDFLALKKNFENKRAA